MKRIIILAALMLLSLTSATVNAQHVVRNGNTFTQIATTAQTSKKTQYTYKDAKGNEYPVYLSAKGKAYIVKTSGKTGKEYKQYLPEVGKQINPSAYADNTKKGK